MLLTKSQIQQFTETFFSKVEEKEKQQKIQRFSDRFDKFNDSQWIFYTIEDDDSFLSFHIQPDYATNYILFVTATQGFVNNTKHTKSFVKLLNEVTEFMSNKFDSYNLESRCIQDSLSSAAFKTSVFRLNHTRHEYKLDLHQMKISSQDKIQFKSYKDWGLNLELVAQIMTDSAYGDPDFSEDDDALQCLESYLGDSHMYSSDDCIQIGKVGEEYACIVVPQSEGLWGTLTYLGIIPKFRGRDLGKVLHKHGLDCLYAQGARDYHGGTLEENRAMQKVFVINGCELYRFLQVWKYQS